MARRDRSEAEALNFAIALHRSGDLAGAAEQYAAVLRKAPREPNALRLLGVVELQRGNLAAAEDHIGRALRINPHSADSHYFLGRVMAERGKPDDAARHLARSIELEPRHTNALISLGLVVLSRGEPTAALAHFERACEVSPQSADAWRGQAACRHQLRQLDRALACYETAVANSPHSYDSWVGRGEVLSDLVRHGEAAVCFERAIALKPDAADAHRRRGHALFHLGRLDDALASYDRALALKPDVAEAIGARASVMLAQRRYAEAADAYARALALAPDFDYAAGALAFAKLQCCDWNDLDALLSRLVEDAAAGKRVVEPFVMLAVPSADEAELACARTWVADRAPAQPPAVPPERAAGARLRIAYVSADMYDHAVPRLMAGLIERHDRSRFEIIGVSLGPDRDSAMRQRLKRAFDRFEDARLMSDRAAADLMRAAGVDIAVDLQGFTQGARTRIFALRAAPLQVNFLGYPGTMGADYIDYIIADRWTAPADRHCAYAEKVVTLPDSYQVNDAARTLPDHAPTRGEAGLPESGFVFCSFNNSFKILPAMFDVWMRLLRDVDGSVLWLYESNAAAVANLRAAAHARGVAPERLVFAPHAEAARHLARHRLADLFLDTLPYNAHTTASDALWSGLPMVTCPGSTFAGRVGASLLSAIGLPELITGSLDEYAALALALARDPERLGDVKARLARNRLTEPLFDTDRFARHIEAAYGEMFERQRRGEPPASFSVEPLPRA